jgi:SAM-dependent methyltransferase
MDWFADQSFWSTFGSVIYSDDRLRKAPDDVAQLLALAKVSRPEVLDLCCGTGRHAMEFAKRGCRVTGVDRTPASLEQARTQAAAEGVDVEFVEGDMRAFSRPGAFDLVVNLFTSFGYFERADDERLVLARVYENLRPGGTFILDVMGKELLARVFQATRSVVAPDGTLVIWRTDVAPDWTRIKGEWYAVRDGLSKRFDVDHWIYSGAELREMLRQAGFREVSLFGDLDQRPYDLSAVRLIAVGRK